MYIKKLSDKQICHLTTLLLTPHSEILQPLLQLKQIKVKTTEATYPCLIRPSAQHNTAASFTLHTGLNWSTGAKKIKATTGSLKQCTAETSSSRFKFFKNKIWEMKNNWWDLPLCVYPHIYTCACVYVYVRMAR